MPALFFEREGSPNILVSGGEGRTAARQNVLVATDYRNVHRRWTADCCQYLSAAYLPANNMTHTPGEKPFIDFSVNKLIRAATLDRQEHVIPDLGMTSAHRRPEADAICDRFVHNAYPISNKSESKRKLIANMS